MHLIAYLSLSLTRSLTHALYDEASSRKSWRMHRRNIRHTRQPFWRAGVTPTDNLRRNGPSRASLRAQARYPPLILLRVMYALPWTRRHMPLFCATLTQSTRWPRPRVVACNPRAPRREGRGKKGDGESARTFVHYPSFLSCWQLSTNVLVRSRSAASQSARTPKEAHQRERKKSFLVCLRPLEWLFLPPLPVRLFLSLSLPSLKFGRENRGRCCNQLYSSPLHQSRTGKRGTHARGKACRKTSSFSPRDSRPVSRHLDSISSLFLLRFLRRKQKRLGCFAHCIFSRPL